MSPPLPLPPFFPFPFISSFVSSSFHSISFPLLFLSFPLFFFLSFCPHSLHLSLPLSSPPIQSSFQLLPPLLLPTAFLCPYYTSFRPFLLHFCLNFPPHSFPIARLPLPILFSSIYSSTSCLPSSSLFPCPRSPSICPTTPSSSSFSFSLTLAHEPFFFLLSSSSFLILFPFKLYLPILVCKKNFFLD